MNDKAYLEIQDSRDSNTILLLKRIESKLDRILKLKTQELIGHYISVKNAAIYTGLSDKTVRRLISSGKLVGYRPARGKILLRRAELDAYITSCTQTLRKGRGIRR